MNSALSLSNPLISTYIFYNSVLGFKMLFMSSYTVYKKVRNTTEHPSQKQSKKKNEVTTDNDDEVLRTMRAHNNDVENIPAFMIISLLYVLSGPSVELATNLFRIYTVSRILHSFVYAVHVVPQPARFLLFIVGWLITYYMALYLICQMYSFW